MLAAAHRMAKDMILRFICAPRRPSLSVARAACPSGANLLRHAAMSLKMVSHGRCTNFAAAQVRSHANASHEFKPSPLRNPTETYRADEPRCHSLHSAWTRRSSKSALAGARTFMSLSKEDEDIAAAAAAPCHGHPFGVVRFFAARPCRDTGGPSHPARHRCSRWHRVPPTRAAGSRRSPRSDPSAAAIPPCRRKPTRRHSVAADR